MTTPNPNQPNGADPTDQDLSQLAEFANYSNTASRDALAALQSSPDYEQLAAFLNAIREGFLVIDVTGTTSKKRGTRARTLRTAQGQLVLPIFTSMAELRLAITGGAKANSRAARRGVSEPKGAVMPAREALQLITGDRFVAAEFDSGSAKQVLLRRYIELAAGEETITATSLAGLNK